MKVAQYRDRLHEHGARAVFVTFDDPQAVRSMLLADVESPGPVLVDHSREAYHAWGLGRVSFRRLWLDPNLYRQYASLLRSGERIRGSGNDSRQLGGDFVVDPEGRIAYSRPQQRDDRPPVGALMKQVEEVAR